MSDFVQRLRGVLSRAAASVKRLVAPPVTALVAAPARRADARARAICPVDDWSFTPLYTDGACPLCGWEPPGYSFRPPLLHKLDWYWATMLAIIGVSAVMLVAVLSAYLRT